MRIPFVFYALAFLHTALAHFELLYPPSRGFNENTESNVPCGGANTVGNRTQMPLSNAFLQIYSSHPVYIYGISIVPKSNPVLSDFTTNLTNIGSGDRNYPGQSCLPINMNLDPGIRSGTNATIQIQYNGGDSILYQCTDVTFTDSASGWNSSACYNASADNKPDNLTSAASHGFFVHGSLYSALISIITFVAFSWF